VERDDVRAPRSQGSTPLWGMTRMVFLDAASRLGLFERFFPKARRVHELRALVEKSELFDVRWYVLDNPDVRKSGIDPLSHFIKHGDLECRPPGPGVQQPRLCGAMAGRGGLENGTSRALSSCRPRGRARSTHLHRGISPPDESAHRDPRIWVVRRGTGTTAGSIRMFEIRSSTCSLTSLSSEPRKVAIPDRISATVSTL
jgi:hypothetical protein